LFFDNKMFIRPINYRKFQSNSCCKAKKQKNSTKKITKNLKIKTNNLKPNSNKAKLKYIN